MDHNKLDPAPPRGMRDFPPDEILLRDRIFDAWTDSANRAGFLKYEGPLVENFELLARKAGEEVAEQIYVFTDKSDRRLALRPEATPSLVRIITANRGKTLFPAKWWTIAQCYRYERMTRGRKREHFQWNLDILGETSVGAEAWIIAAAVSALEKLGLTPSEVKVRYNHRGLIAELLSELGIKKERHLDVLLILDKQGKMETARLKEMLVEKGLDANTADILFEKIESLSPETAGGTGGAKQELMEFLEIAEKTGISEWLAFDPGIVRGLAYYTGIVFEAYDVNREFRAIFGGGRYDNLFGEMTGDPLPAVGLGFGDVVVAELLSSKMGNPHKIAVSACVGAFDKGMERHAIELAKKIIDSGTSVDLLISHSQAGKFFKYADRRGARFAVFLAPAEFENGSAVVKELSTGLQTAVALGDIPSWLSSRLK